MPQRIQRKRTRGWRMPEGAVYVGRPSSFGNPFFVESARALPPSRARMWAVYVANLNGHVSGPLVRWDTKELALADAVDRHRRYLAERRRDQTTAGLGYPWDDQIRKLLAGKDLACWCPLDQPCHADVLLEIANATPAFNPAYRVARCGDGSAHAPHVVDHGPDQPRNCPGFDPRPATRAATLATKGS